MLLKAFRNSFLLAIGAVFVLGGFEETVTFTVFTKSGDQFVSTLRNDFMELGCDPKEKYAIIVHGWLEGIETNWVHELVGNLQRYRGGCIIFMDYSNHSMVQDYFFLVRKFIPLTEVLVDKLRQLENQGFNPDNLFIYGFSFGAQLAINAGNIYGLNRVAEIDVCDPAGPGFTFAPNLIPTLAAKNVQCIHTSASKGTMKRNCHQDWLMGRCGRVQEAAGPTPRGSHGLCPHFYNSAFTNNFYATENIFRCSSRRLAQNVPESFKMGYMETRKNEVFGDLFSPTSECFPYNNFTNYPIELGLGRLKPGLRRASRQRSLMQRHKCSQQYN